MLCKHSAFIQGHSAYYSLYTSFAAERYALCGILLLCRTAGGLSGGQMLHHNWGKSQPQAPSEVPRHSCPDNIAMVDNAEVEFAKRRLSVFV